MFGRDLGLNQGTIGSSAPPAERLVSGGTLYVCFYRAFLGHGGASQALMAF